MPESQGFPTVNEWERRVRSAVRAVLLTATDDELRKELQISVDRNDDLRAKYVQEIIDERSGER